MGGTFANDWINLELVILPKVWEFRAWFPIICCFSETLFHPAASNNCSVVRTGLALDVSDVLLKSYPCYWCWFNKDEFLFSLLLNWNKTEFGWEFNDEIGVKTICDRLIPILEVDIPCCGCWLKLETVLFLFLEEEDIPSIILLELLWENGFWEIFSCLIVLTKMSSICGNHNRNIVEIFPFSFSIQFSNSVIVCGISVDILVNKGIDKI